MSGPTGAGVPGGVDVLADLEVRVGGQASATAHAARLLGLLGASVGREVALDGVQADGTAVAALDAPQDPAGEWARSGAMALTGDPEGAPLVAPGSPAATARGAGLALEVLTAAGGLEKVHVDGGALLGERAAIAGLSRAGSRSAGGSCRMLPTGSGWVAVNLPRDSDHELLPAWLEVEVRGDPWDAVAGRLAGDDARALVDRAALMGLAVASVGVAPGPGAGHPDGAASRPVAPWRLESLTPRGAATGHRQPGLVVDLSALWAGPLCADLLGLAGFHVVKVESLGRPDGARLGPPAFYDLLHGGHRSVALDLGDPTSREALLELMAQADVVVESSRPRALDGLGLGPSELRRRAPQVVWVSVTGYGRDGAWKDRVAFGDDAAAAAGLVAVGEDGRPRFCGDAIADPLAGLHAAVAAVALWRAGRGGLVDVSLWAAARSVLAGGGAVGAASPAARRRGDAWVLDTAEGVVPVRAPRARQGTMPSAPSGAHTAEVLGALAGGAGLLPEG